MYYIFGNKQTYFENHHHRKKLLPKTYDKSNASNFSVSSHFLIALCSTILSSILVADLACFNVSSNIAPKNLLNH